jgi:hypothetical protein
MGFQPVALALVFDLSFVFVANWTLRRMTDWKWVHFVWLARRVSSEVERLQWSALFAVVRETDFV